MVSNLGTTNAAVAFNWDPDEAFISGEQAAAEIIAQLGCPAAG